MKQLKNIIYFIKSLALYGQDCAGPWSKSKLLKQTLLNIDAGKLLTTDMSTVSAGATSVLFASISKKC